MSSIPWELAPTMQELQKGVDPDVLADLGYPVPDQYLSGEDKPALEAPNSRATGEVAVAGAVNGEGESDEEDLAERYADRLLIDGDPELTAEWERMRAQPRPASVRPVIRSRKKARGGGGSRPPFNATTKQVIDPYL